MAEHCHQAIRNTGEMTDKRAARPTPAHLVRARNGKGAFARTVEAAERDGEAARMKSRGATYAEIAEALGYAGTSGAKAAVQRAIDAAVVPAGEALVAERRSELGEMRRHAWSVVQAPGYVTSPKGDVVLGPDGSPLVDQAARLSALNTLVKVSESERRLLGLDARDGLREREVRVREAELDIAIRALELAARTLGMDVDSAQVAAVIEGALVQVESQSRALPPAGAGG